MAKEKLGGGRFVRLPEYMEYWLDQKSTNLQCSEPAAIRWAIAFAMVNEPTKFTEEDKRKLVQRLTRKFTVELSKAARMGKKN